MSLTCRCGKGADWFAAPTAEYASPRLRFQRLLSHCGAWATEDEVGGCGRGLVLADGGEC